MSFRSLKVGAYPLLIAGMAFVALACAGAVPHLSKSELDKAQAEQHLDLEYGRKTFIQSCAGCHELPPPANYTLTQWEGIFPEMSRKAHLDFTDSASVYEYIKVVAKK